MRKFAVVACTVVLVACGSSGSSDPVDTPGTTSGAVVDSTAVAATDPATTVVDTTRPPQDMLAEVELDGVRFGLYECTGLNGTVAADASTVSAVAAYKDNIFVTMGDGAYAYSASSDGCVMTVDEALGDAGRIDVLITPNNIAVANGLFVGSAFETIVTDLDGGEYRPCTPVAGAIALTGDASTLYVSQTGGTLHAFDLTADCAELPAPVLDEIDPDFPWASALATVGDDLIAGYGTDEAFDTIGRFSTTGRVWSSYGSVDVLATAADGRLLDLNLDGLRLWSVDNVIVGGADAVDLLGDFTDWAGAAFDDAGSIWMVGAVVGSSEFRLLRLLPLS